MSDPTTPPERNLEGPRYRVEREASESVVNLP